MSSNMACTIVTGSESFKTAVNLVYICVLDNKYLDAFLPF